MIFDKGYDFALWCILTADKKNRPKIIEFIKSIPQELLTKINDNILQLREHEKCRKNKDFYLYDSVNVDEDTCFSFQISEDGTLRLSKEVKDMEADNLTYKPVFEIILLDCLNCLFPYYLENFDEESLGTIESNIKIKNNLIICNEREYNLIKTPIGYLVTYNREDALILKVFGRFINLNKMPDDLNISDLDKFDKQHFDVLAIPCNRNFVVDLKKAEEFKNLKPNYELREENEKFLERVDNIKMELDNQDKVLRKTKNPNNK